MKFIISVALLAVVLTVVASEHPLEKLKKAREECNADPDTKADPEKIEKLKAGTATDEDKTEVAKHDLCVNVKLGIQKPNGDIDLDNLKKGLEDGNVDKAKSDKVITDCGTRTAGSTAENAALALAKCLYENLIKK